jgi:FMN-dependent oxidoreductase (nitrilotriacetate monooxygenase family)
MTDRREIRLNAFAMNCVGHQAAGLWTHPDDRSAHYRHAAHWVELAQLLERGLFDALFLADVLGVYDVYAGSADTALRTASQVPVNDPLLLVPLMAHATRDLGFGVTCTVGYEHPYPFARRMSTLDHLTGGRVGWNVVTGYLDSAARNMGLDRQMAHDSRYDHADEYMEVCYRLWEASWADDAVRRDAAARVFTDPARVRPIAHHGTHFDVPGIHLCEPSPQRTPVIWQAGASARGQRFSATHAECVFVSAPTRKVLAGFVRDIRTAVAQAGRDPHAVRIFAMFTVVVDATAEAAQRKFDDYRACVDVDGALALMSGWTGVDLSKLAPDTVLRWVERDAGRSALESFTRADPDREWTVGEIAQWVGIGGRGPVVVGDPVQVVDEMEAWVDATDIDGFNLTYVVMPGTFADVVEFVVPELQRRGRYKTTYRPGTLREKLFGGGARLGAGHPAGRWRESAD